MAACYVITTLDTVQAVNFDFGFEQKCYTSFKRTAPYSNFAMLQSVRTELETVKNKLVVSTQRDSADDAMRMYDGIYRRLLSPHVHEETKASTLSLTSSGVC